VYCDHVALHSFLALRSSVRNFLYTQLGHCEEAAVCQPAQHHSRLVCLTPMPTTLAKALCLHSQSPQACKPVRRAPTGLTTAVVEWNALLTILAGLVTQYQ